MGLRRGWEPTVKTVLKPCASVGSLTGLDLEKILLGDGLARDGILALILSAGRRCGCSWSAQARDRLTDPHSCFLVKSTHLMYLRMRLFS